jgi:hypothetical protein
LVKFDYYKYIRKVYKRVLGGSGMSKHGLYDRITLESIEVLINSAEVYELGRGSIRASCLDEGVLIVNVPKVRGKFNRRLWGGNSGRNDFLWIVNKFLADGNIYAAEIDFSSPCFSGLKPYVLKGRFYLGKGIG